MKLSDMKVEVLRNLQPMDILVLQTDEDGMREDWRERLGQFVGFLRQNYNWKGIIITLKPHEKLSKLNEKAQVQLYNTLRDKFEGQ